MTKGVREAVATVRAAVLAAVQDLDDEAADQAFDEIEYSVEVWRLEVERGRRRIP